MFWKLVIVLAYLLLMGLVGFLTMKKNRTASDFFLGNRNIGPWMSAFAYGTTYFSAVIFIGYAGKIGWHSASAPVDCLGQFLDRSFLAWESFRPQNKRDDSAPRHNDHACILGGEIQPES